MCDAGEILFGWLCEHPEDEESGWQGRVRLARATGKDKKLPQRGNRSVEAFLPRSPCQNGASCKCLALETTPSRVIPRAHMQNDRHALLVPFRQFVQGCKARPMRPWMSTHTKQ